MSPKHLPGRACDEGRLERARASYHDAHESLRKGSHRCESEFQGKSRRPAAGFGRSGIPKPAVTPQRRLTAAAGAALK